MSMPPSTLPAGFEALEPFVGEWALAGAQQRYQRRIDSTEAERLAFYAVGRGLLEPALARLDRKPLDAFDDEEQRLMLVLLAFGHVAQAVEVHKEQEAAHARLRRGLTISRASADFAG